MATERAGDDMVHTCCSRATGAMEFVRRTTDDDDDVRWPLDAVNRRQKNTELRPSGPARLGQTSDRVASDRENDARPRLCVSLPLSSPCVRVYPDSSAAVSVDAFPDTFGRVERPFVSVVSLFGSRNIT